jgi:choice-of-anchor C domain-containing protein
MVTGEGVDLVDAAYWQPGEGKRSIDLDGSARSRTTPPYAHGGISQTFPTIPGQSYVVAFLMAGNTSQPPPTKPMRISAAGQAMEFTFDIRGKSARNMGWQRKGWTFVAKEASTTLEFVSLTVSPLTGYGPAIDDVSVTTSPEQIQVTEDDREIQVLLGSEILFDTGKFDLRPAATDALQKLAAIIKTNATLPVVIEGHTDSVGQPQANQVLSENRAKAVMEWLVSKGGVAAARIKTKGFGQTAPVASNDTPEGRQKNRRVEIRLPKTPR